jgi:hypothetical protein
MNIEVVEPALLRLLYYSSIPKSTSSGKAYSGGKNKASLSRTVFKTKIITAHCRLAIADWRFGTKVLKKADYRPELVEVPAADYRLALICEID